MCISYKGNTIYCFTRYDAKSYFPPVSAFDGADFLEDDFPTSEKTLEKRHGSDREQLESQGVALQKRIADLNHELEEVERERSTVEDSRRRFTEFETGREEMLHHITRSLGLLTEAEHDARRDAEQMSKTIVGLQDALTKVDELEKIDTNANDWKVNLTRSLTVIENARMEMNAARLKWTLLTDQANEENTEKGSPASSVGWSPPKSLGQIFLWGLALTWPLLLLGTVAFLYHVISR